MKRTRLLFFIVLYATFGGSTASAQREDPIAEAKRLRDAHEYAAAANALVPYLKDHPDDAGTHWFRAQLLMWSGNRDEARREYERALQLTPPGSAASDSLTRYVADLSSTWASASATVISDDQPLRSTTVGFQAGHYAGAHVAVIGDASRSHYTASEEIVLRDAALTMAQLGLRVTTPSISFGIAAGGERLSSADKAAGIGNAWIAFTSFRDVAFTASGARSGYHWTVASMDTLVTFTAIEAGVERLVDHGITGRFALRREHFDDDNAVAIAYGWIMLPFVKGLRLGYAADTRDADESRWNGAHYDPYYTPENVHVHSAIAAWGWHDFQRSIQVNGGVGIHARELAPYVLNPSGHQFGFTARSYTPWNVAASATWRITWRTSLHAEAHHTRTAFYNAPTAQFGTTLLVR